ncbi:MAG: hypothetical protein ACLSWI_08915 [Candidatus Gastranaerophilaceae bacterium]
MNSKTAETKAFDCVEASNFILEDVVNLELEEPQIFDMSLNSTDLLIKDAANLIILDEMTNFSDELLEMIDKCIVPEFVETKAKVKVSSIDEKLAKVQEVLMTDITAPLHTMFDDFANYITRAIA